MVRERVTVRLWLELGTELCAAPHTKGRARALLATPDLGFGLGIED